MLGDAVSDRPVGRQVNAKRLLGHEMLAGLNRCAANLLVQMMRHGDVHRFHVRIGQQLAVVVGELPDRGKVLAKPIEGGRDAVAHGHDFRPGTCVCSK